MAHVFSAVLWSNTLHGWRICSKLLFPARDRSFAQRPDALQKAIRPPVRPESNLRAPHLHAPAQAREPDAVLAPRPRSLLRVPGPLPDQHGLRYGGRRDAAGPFSRNQACAIQERWPASMMDSSASSWRRSKRVFSASLNRSASRSLR